MPGNGEAVNVTCVECGSPFERPRRRGRPRLTCSSRCKALRTAALAEQRAADACLSCGAERRHWRSHDAADQRVVSAREPVGTADPQEVFHEC
jgi:hypothetical protein